MSQASTSDGEDDNDSDDDADDEDQEKGNSYFLVNFLLFTLPFSSIFVLIIVFINSRKNQNRS